MSVNTNNAEQNNQDNTALEFDPTGKEPLDIQAYLLSLADALKDDKDALQDLNVLAALLQANISILAQAAGIVLIAYLENGQIVLLPARLQR